MNMECQQSMVEKWLPLEWLKKDSFQNLQEQKLSVKNVITNGK